MSAVSQCASTDSVELRSDQTVLRSFVHKQSIENVLLFLGVSTGDVFIFEGSQAVLTDAAWTPAPEPVVDPVTIDIAIQDITRRKNDAISRVVAQHRMSIRGELVFHGTGAWTVQPEALFRRCVCGHADSDVDKGRSEREWRDYNCLLGQDACIDACLPGSDSARSHNRCRTAGAHEPSL